MFKKKRILTFFIHEQKQECMFFNQQLASAYCVQIFPEVSSRYRGSWSKDEPKFEKSTIYNKTISKLHKDWKTSYLWMTSTRKPSPWTKYLISTRYCFKYMFKAYTKVCFFMFKPSLWRNVYVYRVSFQRSLTTSSNAGRFAGKNMMRAYLSDGSYPYLKISINEYAIFSDRSHTSTCWSRSHSVGIRNRIDPHSHFPLLVNGADLHCGVVVERSPRMREIAVNSQSGQT